MQSSSPPRPVMDVAGPPKPSQQQVPAANPKSADSSPTQSPAAQHTAPAPNVKEAPIENAESTASDKPKSDAAPVEKSKPKPQKHSAAAKPGAPVGVIVATLIVMMALVSLAVVVYIAA